MAEFLAVVIGILTLKQFWAYGTVFQTVLGLWNCFSNSSVNNELKFSFDEVSVSSSNWLSIAQVVNLP